ncbi:hypothetical protein SmJEL517_g00157 [Synchytrium microbalum]|uniref:Uncharacterized protein n=1 Tax=Synchytrium microbalum TaxID=1806994 RepID=A0A507CJB1_9FUNG|nr:uncharacterized protein SmJEL517_g00157 [Synchytrium microbalum]TPX38366.1 hypothetical protein SmJEL517_g00157 [Synchytrium microbalum]
MDLKRVKVSESIPVQFVSTLLEPPPGYKVVQQLGLVRGITVRSRNVIASIGAGLRSLVGGNIETFRVLCEDSRQEAYNIMVDHAFALGANCVLCARYDNNDIDVGITEMLCYGTAVRIEPIKATA